MAFTGNQKREYQNAWMQRRRQEWIDSQGGKCKHCGSAEELEVDHIDASTKSMNPAQIWGRCKEAREVELAKCQVLCKPCHLEKRKRCREYARGEKAGGAKLTEEQVRQIKSHWAKGGWTKYGLGREFNIDEAVIRGILAGRFWRHVD
jgi:5-methylcytosine-specific restriction endonuclease McrA